MKGKLKDRKTLNHKPLKLTTGLYFGLVSFICFFMGFILFFYCMIYKIDPLTLEVMSSPLHYLVLGVGSFTVSMYHKIKPTQK